MENLFESQVPPESSRKPLAERMRPGTLEEFVGQRALLGPGKVLAEMIESDKLVSMILWGPPGVGKTTLARVIAARTGRAFHAYSAATSGIRDIKEVMEAARLRFSSEGRKTILFIDEVHRFNKAQQDAFLSFVEDGTITFIGATTENPSFEVNGALLSRCRVFEFSRLSREELAGILDRALADARTGLGGAGIGADPDARAALVDQADGDARQMLNVLEIASNLAAGAEGGGRAVTAAHVREALGGRTLLYDRAGEEHYNVISALHKSLRGSDAQAGLYWLARMLEAGEDPLYVARRLVRFASEDVGLADPEALSVALNAFQAVHFIGMPEGALALSEAVVYLAAAPKSNSLYAAYGAAKEAVAKHGSLPVPKPIRNPVTSLMSEAGYGEGYEYPHDNPDKATGMTFLPAEIRNAEFYAPGQYGFEKEIRRRLLYWGRLREARRGDGGRSS